MNTLEEIARVLKTLKSAVIFAHTRPDGDTLGSGMALCRALSSLGIRSEVVCDSEIPGRFFFLPCMKEIKKTPSFRADGYIATDASSESRLGLLEPVFTAAKKRAVTVNIDHHVSNTRFARYNFVRARASNCENTLELLSRMGIEPDPEIASCLMLGMITDSGSFSHEDVNGDTFRAAALAVDRGAKVSEIGYFGMRMQSKGKAAVYADAISRLRFLEGDKIAIAFVPASLLQKHGVGADATEGIVDFGLTVEGVEVSVCLLEIKKGQYRASFRSRGKVDVNAVAGTFGGGGHVRAAGCMFFGDLEEILDKIRYAVWQNSEDE